MYNPMTKPATIEIDRAKAFEWLEKGAQPTNTARAILRFTGVMYMKHLQRGVTKGAHTQEQADAKLESWLAEKQTKIDAGKAETAQELIDFRKIVDGEVKAPVAPKRDEQAEAAFREESSPEAPAEKVEEAAAEVEEAPAEVEEAAEVEKHQQKLKKHQQKLKKHQQKLKKHQQKLKKQQQKLKKQQQKLKKHQQRMLKKQQK